VTDAAGALLFARFAFPPNALGLCGADAPGELLEHVHAREADGGLAELARTFEGAWPYLELIAASNGIEDPLDVRVVQAYWLGNGLLDRVRPEALVRHVDDRFRTRLGRSAEHVAAAVAAGAVPHHSFHVFAIYPWIGLLREGIVDEPLRVLDRCRITPAVVQSAGEETADVLLRPLAWEAGALTLGAPASRSVRWRLDGLSLFRRPEPGDLVALHWDVVCDALTPRRERELARATGRALRAVNCVAADRQRNPRRP
jgi:uncharacterized protein DUF6390